MSRVEIFLKINKQAGWKKQAGGKMLKNNKRACSFIRYLRVIFTSKATFVKVQIF